jgi:hypothetical protein
MSKADNIVAAIEEAEDITLTELIEIRRTLDGRVEKIKAEFKKQAADYRSNGRKRRATESDDDTSTEENAHE